MPSLTITTRRTRSGPRYVVRYRLGGRAYPIEHGGSFKTLKEAKARRDLIGGELAAGRNPRELLDALKVPVAAATSRTFAMWGARYKASRVDVSPATLANIETHLKALEPTFGDRDPQNITFADVQEWVAGSGLSPGSLRPYIATLRLVLDFTEVEPNPARDKRVRLPELEAEEINPPNGKQFLAVLDKLTKRWVLPLVVLEQVGMRAGEAASLTWGDVDVAENRFRLRAARTKTRKARWVQVPDWLMDEIAATCPLEDRTAERQVFMGFTRHAARNAVARACLVAGVPHFHPHDLRHRRISLWHQQGVPVKQLSERVGHARASMTLDTYSHVMPLDEVSVQALVTLLRP
jgi:integrase